MFDWADNRFISIYIWDNILNREVGEEKFEFEICNNEKDGKDGYDGK